MSRFSGSISFLLMVAASLSASFGRITAVLSTDSRDVNSMLLIQQQWENTPPSWTGGDPCGSDWDGVYCNGTRIASLFLSTMNLTGQMPDEIGLLSGLQILDLSHNPGLRGPISTSVGNLQHLQTLILIGCSFTGHLPEELGNLRKLVTLDVNSNGLSGSIPPSLGNLTKLYWFDIANNSIGGQLPVELKKLFNCAHFHFNKNELNGSIPPEIFHKNMTIKHVLFDNNLFTGEVPSTLGNVSTLEIVRLDRNTFEGSIPSSVGQLGQLIELRLSNNKLNGSIPDLSGMSNLQYIDLSNNSFESSNVPDWLSVSASLITIVMENSNLSGQLASKAFSLPLLETVKFANNHINGVLQIEDSVSQQLQLIDLQNNNITNYLSGLTYNKALILEGNPVCSTLKAILNTTICHTEAIQQTSYQTDMAQCGNNLTCPGDLLKVNPKSCQCAMPLSGTMVLRGTTFLSLTNGARFQKLENSLWTQLNLTQGSVYICCMSFDTDGYLDIQVELFPPPGRMYFDRLEIINLTFFLSNNSYSPPEGFGPYYFIPTEAYTFFGNESKGLSSEGSKGLMSREIIGAAVAMLVIIALGIYVLWKRKKEAKAFEFRIPMVSWSATSEGDSGDVPKLKGGTVFSFQEMKMATNNFSVENEIGSGGYGKVYKGILPSYREMVAVKRATQGSNVGASELKNELELLSRVHHKNLVRLIGFCFEEGNLMLVYEYMPNESLRDNLSGKTGIRLDWRKRSHIAFGAATGLAYLHDHADPPIIHRNVKSSNILLDENLNAKVSDFGFSRLIGDADTPDHVSSQIKASMGYLDPEYYMLQRLTHKSDVYSFGVVLMELLASRPPLFERGKYLVREVQTAMNVGGVNEVRRQILDPILRDSPISETLLESFIKLSLRCVDESATNRPKMSDVVKELEYITESLNATTTETDGRDGSETAGFPREALHRNYPFSIGTSSNSFDYSGGSTMTPSVDPK